LAASVTDFTVSFATSLAVVGVGACAGVWGVAELMLLTVDETLAGVFGVAAARVDEDGVAAGGVAGCTGLPWLGLALRGLALGLGLTWAIATRMRVGMKKLWLFL